MSSKDPEDPGYRKFVAFLKDLLSAPPQQDDIADDEYENWGNPKELLRIKHKNSIRWHVAAGRIALVFMYAFAFMVLSVLSVWFWHLLAPDSWHWLSGDTLDKIQALIFNGSLGAIFSMIIQRYFSK